MREFHPNMKQNITNEELRTSETDASFVPPAQPHYDRSPLTACGSLPQDLPDPPSPPDNPSPRAANSPASRLPNETARSHSMFLRYLNMGPDRSFPAVAAEFG